MNTLHATRHVLKRLRFQDWPAPAYWLLPLAIAFLRALPYLATRLFSAGSGEALLRVGYMPPDLLSYLAFIRQAAQRGSVLPHDPYTTTEQSGRFVLLLHWALGQVSHWTGLSAEVVLEASRWPLTFAFFAVLWWFLTPILRRRSDRYWACLLVAMSGGVEGFLKPLTWLLPDFVNTRFTAGVWHLYGWNTFESLYNPLWIAGLTLLMVVIRPALDPQGIRRFRDVLQLGLGWLFLFYVHPYSGLAALAIVAAVPVCEWIFQSKPDSHRWKMIALSLGPPLLFAAGVSRWQTQDAVYRAASSNVLGTLELQTFWYPVTLGAVGLLALWGAQRWIRSEHPWRLSLLAWVGVVAMLHTSPVINGYHFACYLHLPLCIVAAPVLRRLVGQLRTRQVESWMASTALLVLTFSSFLLVTAESLGDLHRHNRVPAAYFDVVETLEEFPDGRAFAPPELGNMIPAYTGHQVWAGHWFLTPNYLEKTTLYNSLVEEPERLSELLRLLEEQKIRYVVVPRACGKRLAEKLPQRVERQVTHDELVVLAIRRQLDVKRASANG